MRKLLVILILGVSFYTEAQQLPVISGFYNNKYMLNPGATGANRFLEADLYYKNQWVGYDGSPATQFLSAHSSLNEMNFGLGMAVLNDSRGVLKNTGFQVSSAYHLPVGPDFKLGVGFTAGFNQFRVDGTNLILAHATDDLVANSVGKSKLTPNVSLGMFGQSEKFYFGVSAMNLLDSRVEIYQSSTKNSMHLYAMTGATFELSKEINLKPNLLVTYVQGFPVNADLRVLASYQETIDFGLGYRLSNDLIITAGYEIINGLKVSYGYDLNLGGLKKFQAGSHEIQLSYRWYYDPAYQGSKSRYGWIKKGRKKKVKENSKEKRADI